MTETVLFVGGSADGKEKDFWFPCRKCGQGSFLVRGFCSKCEPELHQQFNAQMDSYVEKAREFEQETGKTPLSAWNEFEDWCSSPTISSPS